MSHFDGYLPWFLLYTSTSAVIHTVVCYASSPAASLRQFSGPQRPPHTALLAHVYAVKNIYTAAIRAYAAYDISNRALPILSFVGVLWLYASELLLYRTVRMKETIFPFVNAGVGSVWLVASRSWYLR